jgi:hypothetical protein
MKNYFIKMKNSFEVKLFFLFFISCLSSSAQIKKTPIEIYASALVEDKSTNNYSILTYLDGNKKDSMFCKNSKMIKLKFEENKIYTILFKKDNYPERSIIVNTRNPYGIREVVESPFYFEVEFSPNKSTMRNDLDDYPAAILMINKIEKSLIASDNYYKFSHDIPLNIAKAEEED